MVLFKYSLHQTACVGLLCVYVVTLCGLHAIHDVYLFLPESNCVRCCIWNWRNPHPPEMNNFHFLRRHVVKQRLLEYLKHSL